MLSISICSDNGLEGTKTDNAICLNKCFLNSPKCINKCRQCSFSVENCSNLTFQEETKLHHLYSIATDWTLLIDRQAANCRNISDEVFPSIFLGDRYDNAKTNYECFVNGQNIHFIQFYDSLKLSNIRITFLVKYILKGI